MSRKSGEEVAKQKSAAPIRRGKDDVRYWRDKVFQTAYTRNGVRQKVKELSVRIQHRGRRDVFPLGVTGKDAAAAKAKEVYLSILSEGWEAALERYKPDGKPPETITVGEYIASVEKVIDVSPNSWRNYRNSLRQIVAELQGADREDTTRFDYVNGGNERWRAVLDAVKIASLTKPKIEAWRRAYVERRGVNPDAERKARTSANTIVRNGSALFSDDLREKSSVKVENPFSGIRPFKPARRSYQSRFNAEELLRYANDEFMRPRGETENPTGYQRRGEAFKALVVFAFTGLRRKELDLLLWDQVNLSGAFIEVRRTRYFAPKAESSLRQVPLDPDAVAVLRGFRARGPEDEFVMKGGKPNTKATFAYYRAGNTFEFLVEWLRAYKQSDGSKPFEEIQKPIHEVRKEVGAILTTRHGIYAAQSILGHADITTTASYYADQKRK